MNKYLDLQTKIYESPLSRRKLLSYKTQEPKTYKIQVFRNHSFELVERTMGMYLDYARIGVHFSYSGYDDSFSFTELDPTSDLVILWIDSTRYYSDIKSFLDKRITALREKYTGQILIIPFGMNYSTEEKGIYVWNLDELKAILKEQFIDTSTQSSSGTQLSGKALLYISRKMGLQLLPAMLCQTIKAIIVDLDNTLYSGVLGEDGINGILLTDGHKEFQILLKELSDRGFFLCVASKNELHDVKELLSKRDDFPLKWDDFSKVEASWNSKAKMVDNIASYLNIHTDSMVFIDDNLGELLTVYDENPEIKIIHAKEDAHKTISVLREFPGLLKFQTNLEDQKRRKDIQAKEVRESKRNKMSPEDYIRSLSISLNFECNEQIRADRIFELANKTNQFIFNYMRYSRQEVEDRINSSNYAVITVSLSDNLSDSGMIGVCVAKKQNNFAEIEECFVSCRALGRGIDDMIVLGAIQLAMQKLNQTKMKIDFQKGARNLPAETFVKQYLNNYIDAPDCFTYYFPKNLVHIQGI